MNKLVIPPDEDSPEVVMDHVRHLIEIKGESRPEDVGNFYKPILTWLDQYESNAVWLHDSSPDLRNRRLQCNFQLDYFNSTSAKYLLKIVFKFRKFIMAGIAVDIHWYYDSRDPDMLNAGKEFEELTKVKFHYVPVSKKI